MLSDHDVHPDRIIEYEDSIPNIGNQLFIGCHISQFDKPHEKKSVFSNYTSGTFKAYLNFK